MHNGGKALSILIVEDDITTAIIEKKQLENVGYTVIHAESGEKALDLLKNDRIAINLILMDIDLGDGIDGIETAQRILEDREIPILFLSSHTEPEIVHRTEKISSYGYVVKNTGFTVLDASIKMAIKLFHSKKAEIESEAKFKNYIEHSPYGIFIADENGRYIDVNDEAINMTGYTRSELLNMTIPELVSRNPADVEMNSFSELKKKGASSTKTYLTHKDGSRFYVSLKSVALPDNRYMAFCLNITEKVQLEESLK